MEKKAYSRRDFLKIVGATSGLAATGCAGDVPEKIIPYVIQPDEVVPGVATWYSGTCSGCETACGLFVRTREGRAVKVEGNPNHPVSKGGLCAIGQSTLQTLYDPDRVREPLTRESGGGGFKPATWVEAIKKVSDTLSGIPEGKKAVLLTAPLSGSVKSLIEEISSKNSKLEHHELDLGDQSTLDVAAEKSFGAGYRTYFDFSKADTIVSFGADFLGTWISPVEYSKQWAKNRHDPAHLSKFIHIEPRLSLTAANADNWIKNKPGSELKIMTAVLAKLIAARPGPGTAASTLKQAQEICSSVPLGVSSEEVDQIANALLKSKKSLVVAGGPSVSGEQAVACGIVANAINSLLGNIGRSVKLKRTSGFAQLAGDALAKLKETLAADTEVLIVSGLNPVYSVPGFTAASAKVKTVVKLGTNLDETARLAHVVLPQSTNFESWSDSNPRPGVYNLNQPSMQPLYKTLSLGDVLIGLASKMDISFEGVTSFEDYIKAQWKKRTGSSGFEARWIDYVEAGGQWSDTFKETDIVGFVPSALDSINSIKPTEGTVFQAFQTTVLGDGQGANRPWLQELPDPLTSIVWGSWAEIHSSKAKELGIKEGDLLQLRNEAGAIEVPAYVTDNIAPELIAVPMGRGHKSLGRYANGIGVNPVSLLSFAAGSSAALVAGLSDVRKGLLSNQIVKTQDFDDQKGRGLLRTVSASEVGHDDHGDGHGKGHGDDHGKGHGDGHGDDHGDSHAGGHHDPFALGPQPEPKQMYVQMQHPTRRFGMSIDLGSCTGCSACVVACYAENNVPVVGKEFCAQGREMSWLRIDRYVDKDDHDQPVTGFQPMMCQQCGHAPCEPVCPVYATYHNEDGLNAMVYNRCVGTRYCSNNCSYKVRRFNWFQYTYPEPLNWQLNPDVTVRSLGVMEKCSFCSQRIREATNHAKNEGRQVKDGEIQPACSQSCPTGAIKFGNLLDHDSEVYKDSQSERGYKMLDFQINTQPAITYLAKPTHDEDKKHTDHGKGHAGKG